MKKLYLLKTMLLLCALVTGSVSVWADPIISWSRSGSTDSYTTGYTFSATASAKTGYYQDASSGTAGLKLYHTSNALFTKTPTSITFTASVGGGTGNKDLSSSVYVCFVDKDGNVIDGTAVEVTSHITTNTGDSYDISMSTSKATQAYGVYIYHAKESGYNVRYYSFSLSAVVPSKDPIGTFGEVTDKEITVGDNQSFDASSAFTIDANATASATLTVTPGEGDGTYAYYKDGKIYGTAYGTQEFTITATPAAADEDKYATVTKTFNVKVLKVPSFTGITDTSIKYGETHTVSVATAGAISLSSSCEDVATASGNVLTSVAVGTSTITVNSAKNDEYAAGSTTFVLTVTAPTGKTEAPSSSEVVFNEQFSKTSYVGGRDGIFSGSVSSEGLTSGTHTDESWTGIEYTYANNYCSKVGKTSASGTLTSASIKVDATTATLSFSAAGWQKSGSTYTGTVTITNAKFDNNTTSYAFTPTQGSFDNFEVGINSISDDITISFGGYCYFLDDVKVTKAGTAPTATVELNKYGYGTYCSEYPIDFSNTTGYTAWRVSNVASNGTITFTQITEKIKGGQGVLLYNKDADGVNKSNVTVNFADGDKEFTTAENKLFGTMALTNVAENQYYGLSGESFVKVNPGNVPAGKALLPASLVSNARQLTFIFEDTQGIADVKHTALGTDDSIYSISGQRVSTPKKGLYIMNGKKVLVK